MLSSSRESSSAHRHVKSSARDSFKTRVSLKSQYVVGHDEARSFALRTAYLHYLLQPKARRKQYTAAPRQRPKSKPSGGQLIQEYVAGSSSSLKLPNNFATPLLDRVGGVLRGSERLPGFNDAAVKRSFAEAYTAFSEKNFRKTIDKERKFEPLVLIFYSSASKAASKGRAPDDDSWKLLPDRHLALFVRLAQSIIRDHGHDRDRSELMNKLSTLENKLLTNDQNLVGDSSDGTGSMVEVDVPLSYDVKDMPLVQVVANIFGMSFSESQAEINENKSLWTEEAALRDLKAYQLRLNSDQAGALRIQDFQVEEAFQDWKKSEGRHLSQMMLDILTAKPELAKLSTGSSGRPVPTRPQSFYFDDDTATDIGRVISRGGGEASSLDGSGGTGSSSLRQSTSSIRTVGEPLYTFTPPDAKAFYKYILQHAMSYDQLHADPNLEYQPLSKPSMELLTELCVRWRIPQSSRLITLLEVAVRKFLDQELVSEELDSVIDFVKTPLPDAKKPPHITLYAAPLTDIDPGRWTVHDLSIYQQTLSSLHDSLLRELYHLLEQCYDAKPPNIGPVMFILENHIYSDPVFSPREEAVAEFQESSSSALCRKAAEVYRTYLEKEIPAQQESWEFLHVVKLGKSVTKLCDRIRKRYRNTPDIMGVNPLAILVQEGFPRFEQDAQAIIETILQGAQEAGAEIDIEDGFELYKELVEIRRIHQDFLPDQSFAFNIEELLVDFVWRWIRVAETRMTDFVDQAIKQDQFQMRTQFPDQIPADSERHSVSIIDLFMLFNQTTDQIFKLDWANDEHHARFLTALARGFSAGIGRYCEIADQKFAREMDRPSGEEILAETRTTQEKLMRYAKDAWSNKEKVKPFHFFPEVFSTSPWPTPTVC